MLVEPYQTNTRLIIINEFAGSIDASPHTKIQFHTFTHFWDIADLLF